MFSSIDWWVVTFAAIAITLSGEISSGKIFRRGKFSSLAKIFVNFPRRIFGRIRHFPRRIFLMISSFFPDNFLLVISSFFPDNFLLVISSFSPIIFFGWFRHFSPTKWVVMIWIDNDMQFSVGRVVISLYSYNIWNNGLDNAFSTQGPSVYIMTVNNKFWYHGIVLLKVKRCCVMFLVLTFIYLFMCSECN